jgi:hypothetical protein
MDLILRRTVLRKNIYKPALSVVECFETVCGVIERRLGVIWV